MAPEDRARWDRLRRGRRTADFVRHLLDLEERDARRREHEAALAELIRFQDELPPEWKDEAHYVLDSADDFAPIPEQYTRGSFDMREVLASWRRTGAEVDSQVDSQEC